MRAIFIVPTIFLAASAKAAAPAPFTLDTPPGWEDVTGGKNDLQVVAALKGPETSSFILERVASTNLDSHGAIRGFLVDVLTELNRKSGLAFTISGGVEEVSYDNGAAVSYIRAELQGKPRLILAVVELNGAKFIGTLNSAVPDTLLPSIIGSLRETAAAAAKPVLSRQAQSLDGQLSFFLPDGVLSRPLSEKEKKLNFVLAVQGFGSELMVMKIVDDTTALKDQPQLVRGTVQTVDGVEAGTVSDAALLETPAGPDLVYASGRLKDASGPSQFAAGYMPWGYWGYSILAKGPRAAELMTETFKILALGTGALPKLIAETPQIPLPHEFRLKRLGRRRLAAGAGAIALVLGAMIWMMRRRQVVGAR
jgi:hypothetical protein